MSVVDSIAFNSARAVHHPPKVNAIVRLSQRILSHVPGNRHYMVRIMHHARHNARKRILRFRQLRPFHHDEMTAATRVMRRHVLRRALHDVSCESHFSHALAWSVVLFLLCMVIGNLSTLSQLAPGVFHTTLNLSVMSIFLALLIVLFAFTYCMRLVDQLKLIVLFPKFLWALFPLMAPIGLGTMGYALTHLGIASSPSGKLFLSCLSIFSVCVIAGWMVLLTLIVPLAVWIERRFAVVNPTTVTTVRCVRILELLSDRRTLANDDRRELIAFHLEQIAETAIRVHAGQMKVSQLPMHRKTMDRAKQVGQAYRDLAIHVLQPKSDSRAQLIRHMRADFWRFAQGHWSELECVEVPSQDMLESQTKKWVHTGIVAILPFVLFLATRPFVSMPQITVGAVVLFCWAWAVVAVLTAFDPHLPTRYGSVRSFLRMARGTDTKDS